MRQPSQSMFPILALRGLALATLIVLMTGAICVADQAPIPAEDGAIACKPAPTDLTADPIVLHKPAADSRADATIQANHLLNLDFSPFDAQLLPHDHDLTMIFEDSSVVVLHGVTEAGKPVHGAALRLPDGSIISLCALLAAAPPRPAAGMTEKIPHLKIPPDTNGPDQ